jgi:hypothetical protein
MGIIKRGDFLGAFYSLPLSERDRHLLAVSAFQHVMVTFDHGMADLPWLHANGYGVAIRIGEHNYNTPAARQHVSDTMHVLKDRPERSCIEMDIIGCEPEGHLDMTWGSKTGWGNEIKGEDGRTDLERHLDNFAMMRAMLAVDGYPTCSPGYLCRDQDMRFGPPPYHGPQPGVVRWKQHTLEEYGKAIYSGEHVYLFDGTPYDIEQRGERMLNRAIAFAQNEIIIDEIGLGGTDRSTKEESMQTCLDLAEMARHIPRVVRAYTFVQNGTPIDDNGNEQWPPHQLMDSEVCYNMATRWLSEAGVD